MSRRRLLASLLAPLPGCASRMKTRSALLLVFMIAVPAAAMFSHRIPADVRRSIRGQVGRLTAALLPAKPALAAARGVSVTESAVTFEAAPGPTPVAITAPISSLPGPRATQAGADDAAARLAQLGAIGFECRPIAGGGGTHVASCSVPLDGSGQLLRVFHVTGADAHTAATSLLDDVVAWRDRAGLRKAAVDPTHAVEPALRF